MRCEYHYVCMCLSKDRLLFKMIGGVGSMVSSWQWFLSSCLAQIVPNYSTTAIILYFTFIFTLVGLFFWSFKFYKGFIRLKGCFGIYIHESFFISYQDIKRNQSLTTRAILLWEAARRVPTGRLVWGVGEVWGF